MEHLLIGIIVILAILLLLKKKKAPDEEKFPYQYKKQTYFFSKNELSSYRDLAKGTTNLNPILFSKVRLTDIIKSKEKGPTWQSRLSRIRPKHADFVLCDPPSIRPVLVIELDDGSRDRADRQDHDFSVDKTLVQADIPVIHTRNGSGIGKKIEAVISK